MLISGKVVNLTNPADCVKSSLHFKPSPEQLIGDSRKK